jgi:hypothetical protein
MEWIKWLWNAPPPPWQWVGLFVGIIAFVGWLVSEIIHQLCRPKVRVHFRRVGNLIESRIQNMPFRKGCLLQRRIVQLLNVEIAITDIETEEQDELAGTVYCDEKPRKIQFGDGEVRRTIALPPSKQCVVLPIAGANMSKALAIDEYGKLTTKLHLGKYRASFTIWVDGIENTIEREFEIRQQKPYARWIKDGTVKL